MIDFKKLLNKSRCCLCGTPGHINSYVQNIDGIQLCKKHSDMFLYNGLIKEGDDDLWHFVNKEDLKLF